MKNIISWNLSTTINWTHVSSRNATYILAEAAWNMSQGTAKYNITPFSLHRQRENERS